MRNVFFLWSGYSKTHAGKSSDLRPETVNAIEEGENGYNIKSFIAYCNTLHVNIKLEFEFDE